MHNVTNNVGELINISSSCSLPKESNQANYIRVKSKQSVADPLLSITQRMKSYKKNNQEIFIRSYTLDDGSPKVIAFTNKQLEDFANFCCSDINQFKWMLFLDITFQLGPFCLLLTAYQNTNLFVKATEGCPTMIGPLMLCMLKDECTYLTLFQKMTAHMPGLKGYLQGYASDHEKSLRNALTHEFLATVSYICVLHAKRNISEKCSELDLSKALSSEAIKDIFGQGGLLSCETTESYEFLCNKLTAKWNDLESG